MTRVLLVTLAILLVASAWLLVGQYTRAAALLALAADVPGWPRTAARFHARAVTARELTIPTRGGGLRAIAYVPEGRQGRTLVLVTGVHPGGIDEPRLIHFARSLAAVGLRVITPEFPRLIGFEIAPDVTDGIEDVASWAAGTTEWAPDGRVGLAGISFSGGLAIVAAGREPLRDRIAFVLSIGGHGDLLRALETIGGGVLAENGGATADATGLAMVLASVADRVVPAGQVAPLREWARTFLWAAHLPAGEEAAAREALAEADRLAAALPEPAATLARHVRTADTAALRPRLLAHVREYATAPSLSPERSTPPTAPIYLLHGTGDEVIDPDESRRLGRYLAPHTAVRVLVTPVLTHADVTGVRFDDARALVAFLAGVLRQ